MHLRKILLVSLLILLTMPLLAEPTVQEQLLELLTEQRTLLTELQTDFETVETRSTKHSEDLIALRSSFVDYQVETDNILRGLDSRIHDLEESDKAKTILSWGAVVIAVLAAVFAAAK